jgi:hypothetical protein
VALYIETGEEFVEDALAFQAKTTECAADTDAA